MDENHFICNGRCFPTRLKDKLYPCKRSCIGIENPCGKNCSSKLPVKCGDRCLPDGSPCVCKKNERKCGEDCIFNQMPCDGKCHEEYPVKCGSRCLAKDTNNYECKGGCIDKSQACEGKCLNPKDVHVCDDTWRGKNTCVGEKEYQQEYTDCDGVCISQGTPCKGKCPKDMPYVCYDSICSKDKCNRFLLTNDRRSP